MLARLAPRQGLNRTKMKSPAAFCGEALRASTLISDIKPDDCAGLLPLCILSMCAEAYELLSKPFILWPCPAPGAVPRFYAGWSFFHAESSY